MHFLVLVVVVVVVVYVMLSGSCINAFLADSPVSSCYKLQFKVSKCLAVPLK